MKKLLLLSFGISLIGNVINAQTLDENFEYYGEGNLAGQGNWVNNPKYPASPTDPSTTDPIKVGGPGLNGTKAVYISPGTSNGSGPVIPFADGGKLTKNAISGSIYVSFLVKFNALPSSTADNYFFYLADMSASPISTDGRGRIYTRSDGTKYAFGAIASSNSTNDLTYTDYKYEVGKTYLVVEKYEKTSGVDKVSLWIFDQTVTGGELIAPPTSDFSSGDIESGTSKKEISGVGFRRMNASYDIIVDDVRVNTVWGAVSDTEVPLPVQLTSFSGQKQSNHIQLNWTTASEQGNSHFEVLRSENGKNFHVLTTVSGKGTTTQISNYSYIDANPLPGTNYYQLRQVDYDGKSEKSDIIAVKSTLETITAMSVSVPSDQDYIKLFIFSTVNEAAEVHINGVLGNHIASQKIHLTKGENVVQVPVKAANGIYLANLVSETQHIRAKFVK